MVMLMSEFVFDQLAVITVAVTAASEKQAREAAATADEIPAGGGSYAGVRWNVRAVAPRGRGYLVEAHDSAGRDIADAIEVFPEPITGHHRSSLEAELAGAMTALEGDSNDEEHAALYGLAATVAAALGVEFDPDPE